MEMKKELPSKTTTDSCPECGSQNLVHDYDSGETICANCGLVIRQSEIDRGPEWRAFTEEEKASRTRTGTPTTYAVHDKGLSTDVGGGPFGVSYDVFGRKLPLATRLQMWRLRKWQIRSRAHTSIDRNLAQAMDELDRLSEKLYIPQPVKEKAAIIYRKAVKKNLVRGRSIQGILAAALYIACRINEIPRTLREIAEASLAQGTTREKTNEIGRCYRFLVKEFELQMGVIDPISCISKIADSLGISGKTQGLAIEILHQAREKQIISGNPITSGKDPMGLAAAALYIACVQNGEKKTQRDIADVARVTEVTIRNRYGELVKRLGLELPDNNQRKKIFYLKERKNRSIFYFFEKIPCQN